MVRLYGKKIKEWEIEQIIPVPLHWKRKRRRGYNQAEILAKCLGKKMGIRVETKAVRRAHNTKPQKALSHRERKQNLAHAFCVNPKWKPARNILIVDDIYTTGNTIETIARVLREKGVKKVFFLTISIGQGF
jgi:ComF family protein